MTQKDHNHRSTNDMKATITDYPITQKDHNHRNINDTKRPQSQIYQ